MGERLSVLSESRVREIRSLGSMKRDVETESWNLDCGTANRKGRQQLRGTYRHRATSRLYEHLRKTDYLHSDEIALRTDCAIGRSIAGAEGPFGKRYNLHAANTESRGPSPA